MAEAFKRTRAAVQLDRLLDEDGPEAQAIRREFQRSSLWKLRTGRRLPQLKSAVVIERLSKGRITVGGWI